MTKHEDKNPMRRLLENDPKVRLQAMTRPFCVSQKLITSVPFKKMEFTRTRSEMSVHSRIEFEFENVGKIGVPGEKPLGAE